MHIHQYRSKRPVRNRVLCAERNGAACEVQRGIIWYNGIMSSRSLLTSLLLFVLFVVWPTAPVLAAYPAIYANGVLAYTNAARYQEGLPLLASDPVLSSIAARKLQDLFARQYFAHVSPSGKSVADLAHDAGYAYITIGENLALGDFASSKAVVDAWMNSPGHRANILGAAYTQIGIAAGQSMYQGRTVWIVVQSFGLPRSSCPTVDTALKADIDALDTTLTLVRTIATVRESALKDRNVPQSVYKERVDSYNLAAKIYNDKVMEYKQRVEAYNAEVKDLNACITQKTATMHPE
jgi:hypothetical protein